MQTLLIVGGVVLLVAVLGLWWRSRGGQAETPQRSKPGAKEGLDTLMSWQPQATRILTVMECQAYSALRAGLPEHIILAQVPLARFLKVPTRHSYSEWLRRVGVMCADLVVCNSASQVIAVVDVRAPEAQENDRARQRHVRMDRVLQAAGIPLHIWREDALPTAALARNLILGMPVEKESAGGPTMHAASAPPPNMTPAALAQRPAPYVQEDDGLEQRDPPSSTWFDDLDATAPLAPSPMPPRGSGPSIR